MAKGSRSGAEPDVDHGAQTRLPLSVLPFGELAGRKATTWFAPINIRGSDPPTRPIGR